jgi:hypothetical protein
MDISLVVARSHEHGVSSAFTGIVDEVMFGFKPVHLEAEMRCASRRRSKPSDTVRRTERAGRQPATPF